MWLAKPLGIVGIVAALLIIGVLITTAIQRRRAKGKNKQRVNAACGDSPSARVPVFVMIVSTDNDGAALQTLLSVFAQAACPLRVFAGVAEYFAPGIVKPLPHRFTQAAESSTMPFKLGDHVRALRAPMDEYPGHLIALEQVQRFLYRGEPYVLIATPGVVLSPGWDTMLVQAMDAAPSRAVLSMHPPPPTTPGKLGTFLGVASHHPTFASYAIKDPVEGGLPATIPALAWSSRLSFSRGPLPLANAGELAGDAGMTARLLHSGWTLLHPTARPASQKDGPAARESPTPLSLPFDIAEHLGISVASQTVSARGRLGLVPPPNTPAEMTAKVGPQGDVLSMLSRIEVQRQQKQKQKQKQTHA